MKLSRRPAAADVQADPEPDDVGSAARNTIKGDAPKGRATPKRRDAEGRKGPVSAPKTRKEALARQRQLAKEQRTTKSSTPVKPRSAAEQRAALKRGDPSALPRRDQGPTRKLARDYVDSKRMLSHYMLWLFPIFILTSSLPVLRFLQLGVILVFLILVGEWYVVGRRAIALATERYGKAEGSPMSLGFYMGSRAYLPRRWRLPAPQVERGEDF